MHAVDQPVIDLYRKAKDLPGAFFHILAPRDARDGVVNVHLPLIRAARQVEPRQAGDVNKIIHLRSRVQKRGLPFGFFLCLLFRKQ